MKTFNSLILSISLLNFSASAMEAPEYLVKFSPNKERRILEVIKDFGLDVDNNERVTTSNSYKGFKKKIDNYYDNSFGMTQISSSGKIDEYYNDLVRVTRVRSKGDLHKKDWPSFQAAIKKDPFFLSVFGYNEGFKSSAGVYLVTTTNMSSCLKLSPLKAGKESSNDAVQHLHNPNVRLPVEKESPATFASRYNFSLTPGKKYTLEYLIYFKDFLPVLGDNFREYNKSGYKGEVVPPKDTKIISLLFYLPEGQIPDQETAVKSFTEWAAGGRRPYATLFKPPPLETPKEEDSNMNTTTGPHPSFIRDHPIIRFLKDPLGSINARVATSTSYEDFVRQIEEGGYDHFVSVQQISSRDGPNKKDWSSFQAAIKKEPFSSTVMLSPSFALRSSAEVYLTSTFDGFSFLSSRLAGSSDDELQLPHNPNVQLPVEKESPATFASRHGFSLTPGKTYTLEYLTYFKDFLPVLGDNFREYNKAGYKGGVVPPKDTKIISLLFYLPEGQIPDQETAVKSFTEWAAGGRRPYAALFKPPV